MRLTKFTLILILLFSSYSGICQFSSGCMEPSISTSGTSCFNVNACDGSASVSITKGDGPFYFIWDNGEMGYNLNNMDGLCAGEHTVTILDMGKIENAANSPLPGIPPPLPTLEDILNNSCYVAVIPFTISSGAELCGQLDDCGESATGALNCDCPLFISVVAQPASCPTTPDALIHVSIGGGTPPYTITWDDNPLSRAQTRAVFGGVNYGFRVIDFQGREISANVPIGVNTTSCEGGIFPGLEDGLRDNIFQILGIISDVIFIPPLVYESYPQFLCPYELGLTATNPTRITSSDGDASLAVRLENGQTTPTEYDWGVDENTGTGGNGDAKSDLPSKPIPYTVLIQADQCRARIDIGLKSACFDDPGNSGELDDTPYYHLTEQPTGVIVPADQNNILNFVYYEAYTGERRFLNFRLFDENGIEISPNTQAKYPVQFGLNKINLDCSEHGLNGQYLIEVSSTKNEKSYLKFTTN